MQTRTIQRERDLTVGTKYLSINNVDLRHAFSGAALQAGADTDTIKVIKQNDRQIMLTVDMPRLTLDLPELGGQLTPRLWLRNDNGGGSALSVGIGLFRWVCMNGLYIGVQSFGTRLIHRDGPKAHGILDLLPEAMVAAMDDVASGAATDLMLEAATQVVTDPIDVIGSLDVGLRTKQAAISRIILGQTRQEDNANTAWGLYNIVNEAARVNGRSLYRAAVRDMDLLADIQVLAEHQLPGAA